MSILEALESHPYETEQWKSRLRQLYLLAMGSFRIAGDSPVKKKPIPAAKPKEAAAAEEKKPADNTSIDTETVALSDDSQEENKK